MRTSEPVCIYYSWEGQVGLEEETGTKEYLQDFGYWLQICSQFGGANLLWKGRV